LGSEQAEHSLGIDEVLGTAEADEGEGWMRGGAFGHEGEALFENGCRASPDVLDALDRRSVAVREL